MQSLEIHAPVHGKLDELESLQAGWDSDGAPPIDRDVLATAHRFVDSLPVDLAILPIAVPLTSGTIQLEWHRGRRALELEFETPDEVHYLKWDPENQVEDEGVVPVVETTRLIGLIHWFCGV